MQRKANIKNIIISSTIFFIIMFLILWTKIPTKFLGIVFIALFIFLISATMFSVSVKNNKLILKNFFLTESIEAKEVSITNVHTFKQGAFCIVMNNKTYRIKAIKTNYEIIYDFLKINSELQKKMEKLKTDSLFPF